MCASCSRRRRQRFPANRHPRRPPVPCHWTAIWKHGGAGEQRACDRVRHRGAQGSAEQRRDRSSAVRHRWRSHGVGVAAGSHSGAGTTGNESHQSVPVPRVAECCLSQHGVAGTCLERRSTHQSAAAPRSPLPDHGLRRERVRRRNPARLCHAAAARDTSAHAECHPTHAGSGITGGWWCVARSVQCTGGVRTGRPVRADTPLARQPVHR